MENTMEITQKLGIKLTYDPAIPLLGIYPEKIIIQKDTCTPLFTAELFTIARTWKQPKCPLTDEWIKRLGYIHTMEYQSARERNKFESVLLRWRFFPVALCVLVLRHAFSALAFYFCFSLHSLFAQTLGLCQR